MLFSFSGEKQFWNIPSTSTSIIEWKEYITGKILSDSEIVEVMNESVFNGSELYCVPLFTCSLSYLRVNNIVTFSEWTQGCFGTEKSTSFLLHDKFKYLSGSEQ